MYLVMCSNYRKDKSGIHTHNYKIPLENICQVVDDKYQLYLSPSQKKTETIFP